MSRSTFAVPFMSAFRIKPLKSILRRARPFISLEVNVNGLPVFVLRSGPWNSHGSGAVWDSPTAAVMSAVPTAETNRFTSE
jgi:hypothetical protein